MVICQEMGRFSSSDSGSNCLLVMKPFTRLKEELSVNTSVTKRAFILLLLLVPGLHPIARAQRGRARHKPRNFTVPEGERLEKGTPTLSSRSLSGTVTDAEEAPRPGIQVEAVNLATRTIRVDHSDIEGKFVFARLTPGRYQITASAIGFLTDQKVVNVASRHATIVRLLLKKKVTGAEYITIPEGERRRSTKGALRKPPSLAAPTRRKEEFSAAVELNASGKTPAVNQDESALFPTDVEVIEMTLDSETELQGWLNRQGNDGRRLLAVTPVRYGTSLFVLARGGTGLMTSSSILPLSGSLSSEELSTRIKSLPDKTFVGVHQLSDKSFLLVFQYRSTVRSR